MQGRLEHKRSIEEKIEKEIIPELPQICEDYYVTLKVSREANTCYEYLSVLLRFFRYIGKENPKSVDVSKLTETEAAKFLSLLEVKEVNGKEIQMSYAVKKKIYSALNKFYEYLRKKRIIQENYMTYIERETREDDIRRVKLSWEDLQNILAAASEEKTTTKREMWGVRDRLIIYLLIQTGMRCSALTEINLDNIDFDNRILTVTDKRSIVHKYMIDDGLEKELRNWLAIREKLLENRQSDALFISARTPRITRSCVWKIVKKYSGQVLDNPISPHKIRSAFCTLLYQETKDIEFVRKAVGHKRLDTTMRYIVGDGKEKEEAVEIIRKFVN